MENNFLKFPENFLWGASTAAHQVEGGNHNDWTEWELKNANRLATEATSKFQTNVPNWLAIKNEATDPNNYISGLASDHYKKFKEDIAILKKLHLNVFRFSIEWSRIEPQEGQFDPIEIEHYKNVLAELKAHNIEPMVTLWHRTVPLWVSGQGDWSNPKTTTDFLLFTQKITGLFGHDIKYWTILNEPMFCVTGAYIAGQYPPNRKNFFVALKVFNNLKLAHIGAYKIIKQKFPNAQAGIAHAAVYLEPYNNRLINKLIVKIGHWFMNNLFLDQIKEYCDFIGLQYYSRGLLGFKFEGIKPTIKQIKEIKTQSDMGWEIYPQGLYNFIFMMQKYRKPLMITENGIAEAADILRLGYIKSHLAIIHKAINDGADIRGYLHWSLLDNLEWDKGFWPKFGLVQVDRKTFSRTIKNSAYNYADIAKNNGFNLYEETK